MFLEVLIGVLTLGSVVFCVLTVAQGRSSKRTDSDLIDAMVRNQTTLESLTESLSHLDTAVQAAQAAVQTVTYPSASYEMRAQAPTAWWTAFAEAPTRRNRGSVAVWRETAESTPAEVRRRLESRANLVLEGRPQKPKAERFQRMLDEELFAGDQSRALWRSNRAGAHYCPSCRASHNLKARKGSSTRCT